MEARNWEDLPADCLAEAFGKVGLQHLLLDVPLVCKSWHNASLFPKCWKNLDFESVFRDVRVRSHNYTKLIQVAVARSRGTATRILLSDYGTMEGLQYIANGTRISLSDYCTMKDLQYIANECPLLESLRLPYIQGTKEERQSIPELVSKFKELEILTTSCQSGLKDLVTQIGTNCSKFVALDTTSSIYIDIASAFVHFLPNIKYLTLRGSYIYREALVHILRGCRNLVLLDVRDCIGFDEDDAEILELASYVKSFMSKGSMLEDYDYYLGGDDFLCHGWR